MVRCSCMHACCSAWTWSGHNTNVAVSLPDQPNICFCQHAGARAEGLKPGCAAKGVACCARAARFSHQLCPVHRSRHHTGCHTTAQGVLHAPACQNLRACAPNCNCVVIKAVAVQHRSVHLPRTSMLQDKDALVRERAAGTMEYCAVKEVGARDIIQHGGLYQLVACLTDTHIPVRDAAYKVGVWQCCSNVVAIDLLCVWPG